MSAVGKIIHARRKELGYSRAELADRVGVTAQAVANWETMANREPSKPLLPKIAEFLGLHVESLFDGATAARLSVEQTRLRNDSILSNDELQLLRDFRSLKPPERDFLLRMMSGMRAPRA